MISSVFDEEKDKEPCRKNRDIIKYSNRTIEWQGFNFMQIFTPMLLLWDNYSERIQVLTHKEGAVNWQPLIIIVLVTQVLQFVLLRRIIQLFKRTKSESAFTYVNDTENAEQPE